MMVWNPVNYRKIAFTTRSRLQPALGYNPHFSRNLFSKARVEPSLKIVKKILLAGRKREFTVYDSMHYRTIARLQRFFV